MRISILAVLLSAVGAMVLAQGPGPQGPPQGKAGPGQPGPNQPGFVPPGPRPGGPGQILNDPQMMERLGISADQKKKIETVMQEHRLKRIDLNAAMQKAQVMLEPLVSAEQPNENQILAQIDRVAQAQAELQKDEMRLQLEIRRVLTPEQWRRVQQERQAPMAQRLGQPNVEPGRRGPGDPKQ